MTIRLLVSLAVAVLLGPCSTRAAAPPGGTPVAEVERLALAARDLNYAGRWDEAERVAAEVAARDPGEPLAPLLAASTLFWRAQIDMGDRRYDPAIEAAIASAIELAEARLDAAGDDAHGHFMLGEALSFASRLAVERGELLTAGLKGERSRKQFERALELDPSLEDARVPLGAFLYFAGLIPAALDWLSWLPFVPSGDRARGLALLARGADSARLNRLAARSLLFRIDSHHEPGRTEEARVLGRALHREFPGNPVIAVDWLRFLAESGDVGEARQAATAVLDQVAAHADGFDGRVAREARTWLARAEMRERRFDIARGLLDQARQIDPDRPRRAVAWDWLTLGQLADRQGAREEAISFYRRVDALDGDATDPEARRAARAFLDQPDLDPTARDGAVASPAPDGVRDLTTDRRSVAAVPAR